MGMDMDMGIGASTSIFNLTSTLAYMQGSDRCQNRLRRKPNESATNAKHHLHPLFSSVAVSGSEIIYVAGQLLYSLSGFLLSFLSHPQIHKYCPRTVHSLCSFVAP